MHNIADYLGTPGRMISGSKGLYIHTNPKNLVVFNSNIFDEDGNKLWYGDLDITLSERRLLQASGELNKKLYVLHEMDGRFDKEKTPALEKAVVIVYPSNTVEVGATYIEYVEKKSGKLLLKTIRRSKKEVTKNSYNKADYTKLFKINRKDLQALEKKSNPLEKLHMQIIKACKRKGIKAESIGDFYYTKKDEEAVLADLKKWLRKYERLTVNSYMMKKTLAWAVMDLPGIFYNPKEDWMQEGYIYLKHKDSV